MNKEFNTWLVLDWKTGKFKVNKKKPYKFKISEIPIEMKLNVEIPEQQTFEAKANIILTSSKASEILISMIGDNNDQAS